MARSILVPTEGSPLSSQALETALADYPEADVLVLYVMDPIGTEVGLLDVMRPKFDDGAPPGSVSPAYWEEWYESARAAAEEVFADARATAAAQDRTIETVLEFGKPAEVILEYSEAHGVDRIVMGSHCRSGAERYLLGSVAERVVRRAPVPVMVVH